MAATNRLWDLPPPPRPAAPSARPKLLVVNDDAAGRVSLKFLLEAAGFDTRAFASGRGLLASPSVRTADGFVLDHKPRGRDGLNLARRLCSLGLRAPIVLTTGFRCVALETYAAATDQVIVTARIDEELIARLTRMIQDYRRGGLRNST